ncbi:MAG: hypothetical protein Q9192_006843, partial [Flavoplaca navasiana]
MRLRLASSSTSFALFQVNPYLEAVIEVNPDALAIAKKLDEERQNGNVRSSLHGIPVLVKDVPVSIGTETDTSVIGPAEVNGIVGIKPTVGLTSRTGVIPISSNMDSVGVFGRTVADAVHGLDVIAGSDDGDPTTHDGPDRNIKYSEHLASRTALKGAKFGLPWSRCWDCVAPQRKDVASRVFKAIEDAGAEIIRTDFHCAEDRIAHDGSWNWKRGEAAESEFTVMKTDAYNGINAYLSQLSETSIKSVEDIVHFNDKNTGTEGARPGDIPAFSSGQ